MMNKLLKTFVALLAIAAAAMGPVRAQSTVNLTIATNNSEWGSVSLDMNSATGISVSTEVTIGDTTSTTNNAYLPLYSRYEYSLTQQIYTASEIGSAGSIQSLTMWLKNSSSYSRNIEIYMKEIQDSVFAEANSWVSLSSDDLVATGTIDNGVSDPTATTFTLTTPFEYSGNGNLMLCIRDVTGNWSSGVAGVIVETDTNQAIYAYRDGTIYDIGTPDVNGTLLARKNVVKFNIESTMSPIVATETEGVYRVLPGTELTVVATANEGFYISGWSNNDPVTNDQCDIATITMGVTDLSLTAIFETRGGTEGIDEADDQSVVIYASEGSIHIDAAQPAEAAILDLMGRRMAIVATGTCTPMPTGVYFVKVGTLPARKVVVTR